MLLILNFESLTSIFTKLSNIPNCFVALVYHCPYDIYTLNRINRSQSILEKMRFLITDHALSSSSINMPGSVSGEQQAFDAEVRPSLKHLFWPRVCVWTQLLGWLQQRVLTQHRFWPQLRAWPRLRFQPQPRTILLSLRALVQHRTSRLQVWRLRVWPGVFLYFLSNFIALSF